MPRSLILISVCILLASLLSGCDKRAETDSAPQATIVITKIIDKTTHQPIARNTITLRWEDAKGNVINSEQYTDKSNLTTTLPADGKTRLYIIVDALGYATWANAVRMKLNSGKPLSFPVEMEREEGIRG